MLHHRTVRRTGGAAQHPGHSLRLIHLEKFELEK
jgi:hypothetical protein